jgi:hypothetical protein
MGGGAGRLIKARNICASGFPGCFAGPKPTGSTGERTRGFAYVRVLKDCKLWVRNDRDTSHQPRRITTGFAACSRPSMLRFTLDQYLRLGSGASIIRHASR